MVIRLLSDDLWNEIEPFFPTYESVIGQAPVSVLRTLSGVVSRLTTADLDRDLSFLDSAMKPA